MNKLLVGVSLKRNICIEVINQCKFWFCINCVTKKASSMLATELFLAYGCLFNKSWCRPHPLIEGLSTKWINPMTNIPIILVSLKNYFVDLIENNLYLSRNWGPSSSGFPVIQTDSHQWYPCVSYLNYLYFLKIFVMAILVLEFQARCTKPNIPFLKIKVF